jgi:superfamily II DNA or RNA helicase
MAKEVYIHTGFQIKAGTNPRKDNGKFRPWQEECIRKVVKAKRVLIQAPTGNGKSTVAKALGSILMARNPNLRHLVSVPQRMIASSFSSSLSDCVDASWPGIGKLDWYAPKIAEYDSVERVHKFITGGKRSAPSMRVLICTHQALIYAFSKLNPNERKKLKNVLLTLDEVHHSSSASSEEECITNSLGKVVEYYFQSAFRLHMFTATFMRANHWDIIPSKYREGFDYVKYY